MNTTINDNDGSNVPEAVSSERVMVVSSGPPLSLKVLYCLNALGVPADLVDLGVTSIARYSRYRKHYASLRQESVDVARLAEQIDRLAREWGTTVVIPADIGATGCVHEIRDRIHSADLFPVSSSEILDELDDKWRFHHFLERHGIDRPKSVLIVDPERIESADAEGIEPPWMVKPLYSESGHGITVAKDRDDLYRKLRESRYMGAHGMLVQEFVPGMDADISVLAQDGVLVAHVVQTRPDGRRIDFIENDSVFECARQIVLASGYSGVMNIDVRIDPDSGRVVVIECNPRFWYTVQASMWRGINFAEIGMVTARGGVWKGAAPTDGTYYYHGVIAKRLLWRPREWRSIPDYNWCGFMQAASDPMPFIAARCPGFLRIGR